MTSQNAIPKTEPLGNISLGLGAGETKTAPIGSAVDETAMPVIKVSKPIKIPDGVSSNAKQHVVLVRDNSSSMRGHKIDELNLASSALVTELADPENKDGFICSIVDFSSDASCSVFAEPATSLRAPLAKASGGTNFERALTEAADTVEAFKGKPNAEGWTFLRPQVLFLSDGQSQASTGSITALQEIANVTAIAYGSDADTSMLSRIASDGQVHIVGADGDELRKFLAQVGQTLSQDLAKA